LSAINAAYDNFQSAEPNSVKKERITMISQIADVSAHEESTQMSGITATHGDFQKAEPVSIKKERLTMIGNVSAHEESTQMSGITTAQDNFQNVEPVSIKNERITMIGNVSAHEESTQISGNISAQDDFQDVEPVSIKKERITGQNVSTHEESTQMSIDNEVNVKPEPEQSTMIDPIGANSVHEDFTQLSINAEGIVEAEPMNETTLASISNVEAQLDELVEGANLNHFVQAAINKEADSTHEFPKYLPHSVDQEGPVVSNLEQTNALVYQTFSHTAITQTVVLDQNEPTVSALDQMIAPQETQMEVDQIHEEPTVNEEIPEVSDQTRKTATFAKSAEKLDARKTVDFDQTGDLKATARKQSKITPSLNDTIILDDSIIEIKQEAEDSFVERKNRTKPKQLRAVKKNASSSHSDRNKRDDLQAQETLPSVSAPIRSDLLPDEVRHCYRPSMFVSVPPVDEKDKNEKK